MMRRQLRVSGAANVHGDISFRGNAGNQNTCGSNSVSRPQHQQILTNMTMLFCFLFHLFTHKIGENKSASQTAVLS